SQVTRLPAQADRVVDVLHLRPGDPDDVVADQLLSEQAAPQVAQPAGEPGRPGTVAAQDAGHVHRLARTALELQVVDPPAAAAVDVDQLGVEQAVDDVDLALGHQPPPPLVANR